MPVPMRSALLVALALVGTLLLPPSLAAAQTTETVPPEAPAQDSGTVPPTVTAPPATDAPARTTTTTRDVCDRAVVDAVVAFDGRVTQRRNRRVTFDVLSLHSGDLVSSVAVVTYPIGEADALAVGQRYFVRAAVGRDGLTSETEANPCGAAVAGTRNVDGTPIDDSLLRGLRGNWGKVALAIAAPLVAAMVLLYLLGSIGRWRRRRYPIAG